MAAMDDVRPVRCADREALARETRRVVAGALAAHAGRFVALAVGKSTLPLYAALDVSDAAWAGRSITPVDELVPPPSDPARRFSARLAEALPAELRHRLVPIDVDGDPHRRAVELDARFRADGLAVVVLGLGPHRHIAFKQPPTAADAPTRVVDLAPPNLSRLGPVSPARSALTLGLATILAAGSVLV